MTFARISFHAVTLVGFAATAAFAQLTPISARPSTRTSAPAYVNTAAAATASLVDSSGKKVGTLTLTDTPDGLAIKGMLTGLTPGDHGIHIHAVGKCDAPAFTTASSHFNPTTKQHGFDNPMGYHMGDLRNVNVTAAGTATVNLVAKGVTLKGTNGVLSGANGAALVIHAGPDDYKTDPSGGSGARIACGVIK